MTYCIMNLKEMMKMKKNERINWYLERANTPEGNGTHRSEGSNARLKYLAGKLDCWRSRGKGCRHKVRA